MPESFGARLRSRREKSGIALEALAKQTRIKESLLEGLERDDLSQWPSGFYRRAFFRAYASAVGLDPDATFREFQQLHPEPPEADVLTAMAATLSRGDAPGRATGLRTAVESAISSLARLRAGAARERPAQAAQSPARVEEFAPIESAPVLGTEGNVVTPLPPEPQPVIAAAPSVSSAPAAAAAASASRSETDLLEVARLCVELGCVTSEERLHSLMQHAASMIGAAGLIVWAVHPSELQLQAALGHGYSPKVIAQLPTVRRGDNNATAEAFRTMQTRVFNDSASGKCALAIPLRTASGCVGVFAVELERGVEATKSRIAVATLVAAQLAPIADCWSRPASFELPHAVNGEVQTV